MNNDEYHNLTPENQKKYLNELRAKRNEMEKYLNDLEYKQNIINNLYETIDYEKKNLNTKKKEIQIRNKKLKELDDTYKSITNYNNNFSFLNNNKMLKINNIKKEIINKTISNLIKEKIPEINSKNNKNEFKGLIHKFITIIYESFQENEEKKINFRIETKTTFFQLKITSCKFFNIENINEYKLVDEAECIIINEKNLVNDFMKFYSVRCNILKLKKISEISNKNSISMKQDSNIIEKVKKEKKSEIINKFYDNEDYKGFIINIKNKFVGIYPYFNEKLKSVKNNPKELNNSFINLLIGSLLLIFTLIIIFDSEKNVKISYNKIKYFENVFNNSFIKNKNEIGIYIFNILSKILFNNDTYDENEINDINNLFKYTFNAKENENVINNDCLKKFIEFKNNNYYLNQKNFLNCIQKNKNEINFFQISSMHLIIEKIETKKCNTKFLFNINKNNNKNNSNNENICYYEKINNHYNKKDNNFIIDENNNNYYYELIKNIFKDLQTFESNNFLNYNSKIGKLTGSGFKIDFPLDKKYSIIDYLFILNEFFPFNTSDYDYNNYYLLNETTRGITILLTFILKSNKIHFINVLSHFNFLSNGLIFPEDLLISPFQSKIINNKQLFFDIIRLILFTIVIIIYIIEYKDNFNIKILLNYHILLYLISFVLYFSIFILKYYYLNRNENDFILNGLKYNNSAYKISKFYNFYIFLECILCVILIIKLILFLQLIYFFSLFFSTMNKSLNLFVQYFIVIITIILGLTTIAELTWSPYLNNYINFQSCLISILFQLVGYYKIEDLFEFNLNWWVIIFEILLFIINIVFIFGIFNIIFAEALRRSIKNEGYPEDETKINWKMKDILNWFIHYS